MLLTFLGTILKRQFSTLWTKMKINWYPKDRFVQVTLTALTTNTDSIIKKLVTVFAFAPAFKPGHYIKTNPDRSIAVNKITIPGLILNRLAILYRDTRIVHKARYLDCKNARHASLIPASEAFSPDAGILLTAFIRSATPLIILPGRYKQAVFDPGLIVWDLNNSLIASNIILCKNT
jgi:hypothetical protein